MARCVSNGCGLRVRIYRPQRDWSHCTTLDSRGRTACFVDSRIAYCWNLRSVVWIWFDIIINKHPSTCAKSLDKEFRRVVGGLYKHVQQDKQDKQHKQHNNMTTTQKKAITKKTSSDAERCVSLYKLMRACKKFVEALDECSDGSKDELVNRETFELDDYTISNVEDLGKQCEHILDYLAKNPGASYPTMRQIDEIYNKDSVIYCSLNPVNE